jgi:hypothetical protein
MNKRKTTSCSLATATILGLIALAACRLWPHPSLEVESDPPFPEIKIEFPISSKMVMDEEVTYQLIALDNLQYLEAQITYQSNKPLHGQWEGWVSEVWEGPASATQKVSVPDTLPANPSGQIISRRITDLKFPTHLVPGAGFVNDFTTNLEFVKRQQ